MWKDFFYYSKREKRGIVILMVLILVIIGINVFLSQRVTQVNYVQDENLEKEYSEFMASLKSIKEEKKHYTTHSATKKEYIETPKAALFPFDPNRADSVTFIKLGLPKWVASNIGKYRAKGGKFRTATDFKKIYGISEEKYKELSSYIQIIESTTLPRDTIRLLTQSNFKDTLKVFKYTEGTTINLNQADTSQLKKIPGIGSYIARKIVNYRKSLGGFYQIEQLSEINLDSHQLVGWFTIDENEIKQINLNKASIESLKAHPYFNFYQAKVIVEYRKKKGILKGLHQLSLYEEFSDADFERLKYYVCFE